MPMKVIDDVIERVIRGPGESSVADRAKAFDAPTDSLLAKVAANAWKVTDEDIAAAKAAGRSEDEIFELVIAAALGQSKRQYDAAMAAVEEAFR